ncbi:hypothetical protein TNCV_1499621 [Trichonephila clavipes]|nr:hypothetical protein TNCV_1499621 [Trichonephila clavipes]
MACLGYIDFDSNESNSDDDFGSEFRLDISEIDCSDFGTSETESDSGSESSDGAALVKVHHNCEEKPSKLHPIAGSAADRSPPQVVITLWTEFFAIRLEDQAARLLILVTRLD